MEWDIYTESLNEVANALRRKFWVEGDSSPILCPVISGGFPWINEVRLLCHLPPPHVCGPSWVHWYQLGLYTMYDLSFLDVCRTIGNIASRRKPSLFPSVQQTVDDYRLRHMTTPPPLPKVISDGSNYVMVRSRHWVNILPIISPYSIQEIYQWLHIDKTRPEFIRLLFWTTTKSPTPPALLVLFLAADWFKQNPDLQTIARLECRKWSSRGSLSPFYMGDTMNQSTFPVLWSKKNCGFHSQLHFQNVLSVGQSFWTTSHDSPKHMDFSLSHRAYIDKIDKSWFYFQSV